MVQLRRQDHSSPGGVHSHVLQLGPDPWIEHVEDLPDERLGRVQRLIRSADRVKRVWDNVGGLCLQADVPALCDRPL